MECDCRVIITIGDPEIEYCSLHQAAPQMLEVLKTTKLVLEHATPDDTTISNLKKVIAAAGRKMS